MRKATAQLIRDEFGKEISRTFLAHADEDIQDENYKNYKGCTIVVPQSMTDKNVINYLMERDLHFEKDVADSHMTDFGDVKVRADGTADVKFEFDMGDDGQKKHTHSLQCVIEEVNEPGDRPWYSTTIELPTGEMIDTDPLFTDGRRLATLLGIDPSNYPAKNDRGGRWIDITDVIKNLKVGGRARGVQLVTRTRIERAAGASGLSRRAGR